MRIPDVIDGAVRAGRLAFVPLALITLVTNLPFVVVQAIAGEAFDEPVTSAADLTLDAGALTAAGVTGLLGVLAAAVGLVATARVAVAAHEGEVLEWREALAGALPRLGSALWLGLLLGAGLLVAFLALIVPGIWLAVAWSLSFVVLAVEDRRGTAALGRSFGLVRGSWWPMFGLLLLVFLLATVVSALIGAPFAAGGPVAEALGALIGAVVTTPFVSAATAGAYLALRREETPAFAPPSATSPPPAAPDPFGREGEAPGGWLPPTGR